MVSIRSTIFCSVGLLVFGFIALISGICLLSILPEIVRRRVENEVILKPNGTASKAWARPPVKASLQFWIFNITNPNKILQGAKPRLKQKGPYGFRQQIQKRGLSFTGNNTVSFSTYKAYYFDPELSCKTCRLDDAFVIPNIPYLTAMKLVRTHAGAKGAVDYLAGILMRLAYEKLFVADITAGQLLFEGYDDPVLTLANQFVTGLLPAKMGLFYGRNATLNGPYLVKSGADDIRQLSEIISWKGQKDLVQLGWWNPKYKEASMINGTDGGSYRPLLKRSDVLPIFSRDICRSAMLSYDSDVDVGGLRGFQYRPSPEVLDSKNPGNRGFCWPSDEKYYNIQPKLDGGLCLPDGMLDVGRCYSNAPIVMSYPQFQGCADEVKASVKGLSPGSDDDVTSIIIEPTTGVVLSATKKLQLSVAMYADPNKPEVFQKMKPIVMPILWLNESVVLNDAMKKYLYDSVVLSQRAAYAGSYTLLCIGPILMTIAIAAIFTLVVKICFEEREERAPLLDMADRFSREPRQADIVPDQYNNRHYGMHAGNGKVLIRTSSFP